MSFGPELDASRTVPRKTEVVATLSPFAYTDEFEREAEIFVEDFKGLTVLKVKVVAVKTPTGASP